MSGATSPPSEHLARATVEHRFHELRAQVLERLRKTLVARYDSGALSFSSDRGQRQDIGTETIQAALGRLLMELSRDWPSALRQFLIENLKSFLPQQQQQHPRQISLPGLLLYGLQENQPYFQRQEERAKKSLRSIEGIEEGSLEPEMAKEVLKKQQEDTLQFAIYGPGSIGEGKPFILDLWAFLGEQRERVYALAQRSGTLVGEDRASVMVERGGILTVKLQAPLLTIEKETKPITWNGVETWQSFECSLPVMTQKQAYIQCRVDVSSGGARLLSLNFVLSVEDKPVEHIQKLVEKRSPSTAFASYSSEDRIDVLRGLEGIRKGAPHLSIFVDVDSLRAGDRWEEKLQAYIRTSDVFYLFWSNAAAKSKWVDHEWRQALSEKGISFIDPFPLESPEIVSPPRELAQLHFYSNYLAYIDAEKYRKALSAQP